MIKYAKILDNEKKIVSVALEDAPAFYIKHGFSPMDVEKCEWNGNWYLAGCCPEKPAPTIQERIASLESQVTDRNIRGALLGDEFAINKMTQIEEQIAALRKQLEGKK